jgi:hypothetical protein
MKKDEKNTELENQSLNENNKINIENNQQTNPDNNFNEDIKEENIEINDEISKPASTKKSKVIPIIIGIILIAGLVIGGIFIKKSLDEKNTAKNQSEFIQSTKNIEEKQSKLYSENNITDANIMENQDYKDLQSELLKLSESAYDGVPEKAEAEVTDIKTNAKELYSANNKYFEYTRKNVNSTGLENLQNIPEYLAVSEELAKETIEYYAATQKYADKQSKQN